MIASSFITNNTPTDNLGISKEKKGESRPFLCAVEMQNGHLIFRRWLSIGRLYKDQDLTKLVDLILIAYTKQPVDFVMHHFDVIQVKNITLLP